MKRLRIYRLLIGRANYGVIVSRHITDSRVDAASPMKPYFSATLGQREEENNKHGV